MSNEIPVDVILRAKDEMSKALNKATKAVGLFSAAGVALGTVAGNALNGALGVVSDNIGDVTKGMIDGNAEFERYQTQFGVLLGSAGEAKKRLAELADFGAKTPFELPQVVQADKILQSFGLHAIDAKEKFGFAGTDIRTIAGDVAAGVGADFSEIAGYIGKFSAGATGEAIARFQELGIMTRQEMTAMGLEFSKSGELLSPLPKATEVMLQLMKKKFGGMMDAQSNTFEGMMSNLQDWIGGTLRQIGQPIFELLRDKLKGFLEFLGSPEAKGIVEGFAKFLTNAIGSAVDWVTANWPLIQKTIGDVLNAIGFLFNTYAVPAFNALLSAARVVVDAVVANWPLIQNVITTVVNAIVFAFNTYAIPVFAALVNAGRTAIEWIVANWPAIQSAISSVFDAIVFAFNTYVVPAFNAVVGAATGVVDWFDANWERIYIAVNNAIVPIISLWNAQLKPALGDLLARAGEVVDGIVAQWPAIQKTIGEVFAAIASYFDAVVRPMFDKMIENAKGIVEWIIANWPAISKTIGEVFQAVADFWTKTLQPTISGIVSFLISFFDNKLKPVIAEVVAAFGEVFKNIGRIFEQMTGDGPKAGDAMTGVFKFISDTWDTVLHPALTAILQALKDVSAWVADNWPAISKTIGDVFTAIAWAWNNILKPVLDILFQAVGGLIERFKTEWPAISKTFGDVANAIKWIWDNVLKPIVDATVAGFGLMVKTGQDVAKFLQNPIGNIQAGINNVIGGGQPVQNTTNNTFNLSANYDYQSQGTLRDDVRALQMTYAGT